MLKFEKKKPKKLKSVTFYSFYFDEPKWYHSKSHKLEQHAPSRRIQIYNYHSQLIMQNNCIKFKVVIEIHLCRQSVFYTQRKIPVDLNFCPEVQKKERMV